MRKFEFKFSAVQKVAKIREEESLRALAYSQNIYQNEISKKQSILAELQNALNRRESLGRIPTKSTSFIVEQSYIIGLKQKVIQADHAILKASRAVEKMLRSYYAARAQSRRIDTLQEKAYLDYKKEVSKQEQKEIDEMILMRFRFEEESA